MAEFLIKARGNQWMGNLPVDQWPAKGLTQEIFDARGEKGDVVEVRQDGAIYGRLECLPDYVVVKVPKVDYPKAKAKQIERGVYETTVVDGREVRTLRKKRTFWIPAALVDTAIAQGGVMTINTAAQFVGNLWKRSWNGAALVSARATIGDLGG